MHKHNLLQVNHKVNCKTIHELITWASTCCEELQFKQFVGVSEVYMRTYCIRKGHYCKTSL